MEKLPTYWLDIAQSDIGQKIVDLWRDGLGVEAIAKRVALRPKHVREVFRKLCLE